MQCVCQATPLDVALLQSYLTHNYTHLMKALRRIQALCLSFRKGPTPVVLKMNPNLLKKGG